MINNTIYNIEFGMEFHKKQKRKEQICRLIEEFWAAFPNDKAFLKSDKLMGFYARNHQSSEEEREEFQ